MPYQRKEPHFQNSKRSMEPQGHASWSSRPQGPQKEPFHWTMLIDTPQKLIAGVIAILFAFATALYMLLTPTPTHQSSGQIPLIKAPAEPAKILPDNPGGIQVPHQDKMIYDRIDGPGNLDEPAQLSAEEEPFPPLEATPHATEAPPAQVQALEAPAATNFDVWPKALPPHLSAKIKQNQPPQTPAPAPETLPAAPIEAHIPAQAPENTLPPAGDEIAQLLEQGPPPPGVVPRGMESLPAAESPAPSAAPLAQTQGTAPAAVPVPKPLAPAKTAPTPKDTAVAGGGLKKGFRVQLASVPTKAAAEAELKRLRAKNPVLTKYKGIVSRISGEKGTFYKVIAGPMPNSDVAKSVCNKLSQHKTACFVLAPHKD